MDLAFFMLRLHLPSGVSCLTEMVIRQMVLLALVAAGKVARHHNAGSRPTHKKGRWLRHRPWRPRRQKQPGRSGATSIGQRRGGLPASGT